VPDPRQGDAEALHAGAEFVVETFGLRHDDYPSKSLALRCFIRKLVVLEVHIQMQF
jgi:hypothetical protein